MEADDVEQHLMLVGARFADERNLVKQRGQIGLDLAQQLVEILQELPLGERRGQQRRRDADRTRLEPLRCASAQSQAGCRKAACPTLTAGSGPRATTWRVKKSRVAVDRLVVKDGVRACSP